MGAISPTPSRRALLGAFAATSAAIVAAPATAETLRREFEAWDDEPIVLRRTKQRRSDSKFRYHNAEPFLLSIERGFAHGRCHLLYQTGIVLPLAIRAHLFYVAFTADWCGLPIGLRLPNTL